jgi:exonuclease I
VEHTPRAINVHATDRHYTRRNIAHNAHQLSRLLAGAQDQVHDDLWRKSAELVSVLPKPIAVPLDLLHIAKTSITAAMKHGDFMPRIAQLPNKR